MMIFFILDGKKLKILFFINKHSISDDDVTIVHATPIRPETFVTRGEDVDDDDDEEDLVKQSRIVFLSGVCNMDTSLSKAYLKANDWDLDAVMSAYFNESSFAPTRHIEELGNPQTIGVGDVVDTEHITKSVVPATGEEGYVATSTMLPSVIDSRLDPVDDSTTTTRSPNISPVKNGLYYLSFFLKCLIF
jgi:hypothetical protein